MKGKPDKFNGKQTLKMDIRKIREQTDVSYHKVVLRTDETGQSVTGILDDGYIFYPWSWTVNGEATSIGPWDCDGMSPEVCCEMIQNDVVEADDSGKYLACFVEEPVGGPNNPNIEDRAICVVDGVGTVVRACIHH